MAYFFFSTFWVGAPAQLWPVEKHGVCLPYFVVEGVCYLCLCWACFVFCSTEELTSLFHILSFFCWFLCQLLSHVWLFAALWTIACQVLLSMEFSRQEYWSGLPFPAPGDLPDSWYLYLFSLPRDRPLAFWPMKSTDSGVSLLGVHENCRRYWAHAGFWGNYSDLNLPVCMCVC